MTNRFFSFNFIFVVVCCLSFYSPSVFSEVLTFEDKFNQVIKQSIYQQILLGYRSNHKKLSNQTQKRIETLSKGISENLISCLNQDSKKFNSENVMIFKNAVIETGNLFKGTKLGEEILSNIRSHYNIQEKELNCKLDSTNEEDIRICKAAAGYLEANFGMLLITKSCSDIAFERKLNGEN